MYTYDHVEGLRSLRILTVALFVLGKHSVHFGAERLQVRSKLDELLFDLRLRVGQVVGLMMHTFCVRLHFLQPSFILLKVCLEPLQLLPLAEHLVLRRFRTRF
jgi:hypothetical protein